MDQQDSNYIPITDPEIRDFSIDDDTKQSEIFIITESNLDDTKQERDSVFQLAQDPSSEEEELNNQMEDSILNLRPSDVEQKYDMDIRPIGDILQLNQQEGSTEQKQLSSIASFGKINDGAQAVIREQFTAGLHQDMEQHGEQPYISNQQMPQNYQTEVKVFSSEDREFPFNQNIQKQKSLSTHQADLDTNNANMFKPIVHQQISKTNSQTNQKLHSPNPNDEKKPQSLMLSANSKKSASNLAMGKIPNNFTMRSLKSQNSFGTYGSHTNRADHLSYFQKSPHLSDLQDPYAYFNHHQQQASFHTSIAMLNQPNIQNNEQAPKNQQQSATSDHRDSQNLPSNFRPQMNNQQVKSCRTNIYNIKPNIISQRSQHMVMAQGQAIQNTQHNSNSIGKNDRSNNSGQNDPQGSKTMSETFKQAQIFLSQAEEPFILNQNQIKFKNQSGLNPLQQSKNESSMPFIRKQPVSAKTKFGILKSGGSGSRGSNFNSSTSTFPAAPVSKLSEVKNPQKLMSFRFTNQKAVKIPEIATFKNLQELDLSGNLLQEGVKELTCLNYLKKLSLCNNKINDMWELPTSLEILNLSFNYIKKLSEGACKHLKNVTTLDIQNNKLESLENFEHLQRLKRLLAKNNFVRELAPLNQIMNIFEIDLESNAVDSYIDFIQLIKGKNDLILFNLQRNPLMVDIESIDQFNLQLIHKAPQQVTQKSDKDIKDMLELLGFGAKPVEGDIKPQIQQSERRGAETTRQILQLVQELGDTLSYLKSGVLYKNKRVFNKLKTMSHQHNSDNSNHSAPEIFKHRNFNVSENYAKPALRASGHSGMNPPTTNLNLTKDNDSTEDKHTLNLTPESDKAALPNQMSDNKLFQTKLNSSQQRLPNKKIISQSQLFSPATDIKTRRYEYFEAFYEHIVDREDERRLKREKMLNRMKQKQKLLDGTLQGENESNSSDSENNMSQYSDMNIDDSDDDLSVDDTHDLIEPRDDFIYDESCMIDQSSQIIDYQNQRLHDDEVASQTFTSDLDADLNSYKKDANQYGSANNEKLDDHEYLNGSTAGFGKKLREINREINQEQYGDDEGLGQTLSVKVEFNNTKQSSKRNSNNNINLDQLRENKKIIQSDLKKMSISEKEEQAESIKVQQFKFAKQVKTTKNSDEGSKKDVDSYRQNVILNKDGLPLNQSFSIKNIIQNQIEQSEVESLMMNNKIQGQHNATGFQQNQYTTDISKQPLILHNNKDQKLPGNSTIMTHGEFSHKNSQSNQNLVINTESMSFKLTNKNGQNVNTSLNHSLMNNSMAQSIQSVTHTSKKTIIANLKLDLSKCKQDDDEFINDFEDSKSLQTIKSQNFLSSIVKGDNYTFSDLDNQSQVQMEDIVMAYNQIDNIDSMNIEVERDSYRNHPSYKGDKDDGSDSLRKKQINYKSGRDTAPVLPLGLPKPNLRKSTRQNNRSDAKELIKESDKQAKPPIMIVEVEEKIEETPKTPECSNCKSCKSLESKIKIVQEHHTSEYQSLQCEIKKYQDVINKIKQKLNLNGELEFNVQTPTKEKEPNGKQKQVLKLNRFADIILLIFKRMYTDLENQKNYNNNLEVKFKLQQKELTQTIENYHQLQESFKNQLGMIRNSSKESMLDGSLDTAKVMPKIGNKAAKVNMEGSNKRPSGSKQRSNKVFQLKMKEVNQTQIAQNSDSSFSDMEDDHIRIRSDQKELKKTSKKKSAKTMRNVPLSSKDIKSIQPQMRVNSNPKLTFEKQNTNIGEHNGSREYIANTFSSNYSKSQQMNMLQKSHQICESDFEETQGKETNNGLFQGHISQNSQLHILPNSNQVKMVFQPDISQITKSQPTQPGENLTQQFNPSIMKSKKISFQSKTSRSGGKGFTSKKIKSPAVQNYSKKLEQLPQYLNISHSNKKNFLESNDLFQDRESLNSVILSNQHNYQTSRMPVTNSLAFMDLPQYPQDSATGEHLVPSQLMPESSPQIDFIMNDNSHMFSNLNNSAQNFSGGNMINSLQLRSEKRNKYSSNHSNSIKQSFKTQRKMTQGRNMLNPNSQIQSLLPGDNKTQRIQREIFNKSGAANISNIINLQQTYDQDIRKQSINAVIGLSGRATTENNTMKFTRRPQSVAERNRKVQNKTQHQVIPSKTQTSKSQIQTRQKLKYKSKSTERKTNRQSNMVTKDGYPKANTHKLSNARIEQQVHNLHANIHNIQMIQSTKFNSNNQNNSMISKQESNLSNRDNSTQFQLYMATAKQSSVLSNRDKADVPHNQSALI